MFKHLIPRMPLCQHHLLSMTTILMTAKLTDMECERGQITQQPPIPYAVFKSGLLLSASRDTIKLKPQRESSNMFSSVIIRKKKNTLSTTRSSSITKKDGS